MSTNARQTETGAVKRPSEIHSVAVNLVPYVKELRLLPLIRSVNACILMRQLEYWFERYPDEFYKFLSPPSSPHRAYRAGQSWTEELGFSEDEFRNAFDQIGVRYKSKKEYDAAGSGRFQGKFYCSYTDKLTHVTYYYRYHNAVDSALDWLVNRELYASGEYLSETELDPFDPMNSTTASSVDGDDESPESETELDTFDLVDWETAIPMDSDDESPEMEWDSLDNTETTTETTTETKENTLSFSNKKDEDFSDSNRTSVVSESRENRVLSNIPPPGTPETAGRVVPAPAPAVTSGLPRTASSRVTSLNDLIVDAELREEYRDFDLNFDWELACFKDYCRASGKTYADYSYGFRGWLNKKIEHDW